MAAAIPELMYYVRKHIVALTMLVLLIGTAWAQPGGGTLADPPDPDDIKPRLTVDYIQVQGNKLVTDQELEAVLKPYSGKKLKVSELDQLTKSIEAVYRSKGYMLVRAVVPSQEASLGVLVVQVLEGKIGEVTVEGNSRYSSDFLKSRFQSAVPDAGAKTQDFQRALFLLNELPDLSLKAVLTAGEKEGTTDVILTAIEDKPWHLTLGYNNFGTRLTGEHRFGLTADLSSVLTQGDRAVGRVLLATPSDNTGFYQGSYTVPVNRSGTRVGLHYSNGSYTVGREIQVLDIRGDANIFSLSVDQPLARTLTHSSDLNFRINYSDLDNQILGQQLSRDRYTSASLGYSGRWSDSNGRWLGSGSLTKGLGGNRKGDPLSSRLGSSADFTRLNFDVARIQEFNESWIGVARGSLQFTGDSLFSAEQFALGGPDTVRGYSQAETLADQAYNATLELRWSPLVNHRDLFQTVFFVDHGGIVRNRPLPGEKANETLTGAGLGFRVNYEQTTVRLDLGFPISPTENQRGTTPVVYGQLQTRF